MNKYSPNINYTFLVLLVVVTSCNGQVKTDLPKDNINQQTPIEGVQPKIIRTQGVKSGNITCELQDMAGNLWFSTDGEGVYRFDGKSFTNFTAKDGLCDNYTTDIIQDKSGNILIGTRSGICKYDGNIFSNYLETDTLNKLRIISLLEDRDGNIWFGAMNKGIYRHDGTKLSNFLYEYEHPYLDNKHEKFISDIIQDKNGNIWFSSFNRGGVLRYDGKAIINFLPSAEYYLYNDNEYMYKEIGTFNTGAFSTKYVHSPDYITDDMISSISEDKNGNIWFATRRHGACRYDGKTFTSFNESEGFVSYGITAILEDKMGNIWLGTDKNGVFSYDGKMFKNYSTADGLINNSVRSIIEDKEGNLWFGTRSFGLSRFDGKTFTTFSQYDN
jgi:ligand-binding sensor domain-containing protein